MSSLQYIAPAQIVPCPFLKVEEFELRPPDSDDWDAEPPTFPNALQVCTYDGLCRYQTFCCPQAWHSWDAQVLCAGYSVIYTGGDQTDSGAQQSDPQPSAGTEMLAPFRRRPIFQTGATRDGRR